MADHQDESIAGLVKSLVADTRDLVREELALMRAEVREEVSQARAAAFSFGAAVVVASIGIVLLCVALGAGVSYWLQWPAWAGYGSVAVLLLVGAFVLVSLGRREVANIRALPKTRQTVKENVEWMQNKSAPR